MTPMPIGELIGIWVAALLTLSIFSFLYRDNAFFKAGEHVFLGVALAYGLAFAYYQTVYPLVVLKFAEAHTAHGMLGMWKTLDLWLEPVIPMVLGIFILLRVVPRFAWLSRLSFAVYVGGYAGIAIPSTIASLLLPQITSTMVPIGPDWQGAVVQIVSLVGTFATLLFFFFSLEHTGAVGKVSRVGVFFIMVAMGASFGNTVMARVSLLIGRIQFLLGDWIGRAILHHS